MATKRIQSEAGTLEKYRVSLENAEKQPVIADTMAEYGYTSEEIASGKELLAQTRQAYDFNKTEDDETTAASYTFKTKKRELEKMYSGHRRKAKVIFRNNAVTAERLGITGEIPEAYIKWLDTVRKFYNEAFADAGIQEKLTRLKITPDNLNDALALISEVENARSDFLRERGESQDATQTKDAAFAKMDDWMSEFYAVARIALEDSPQLLEALGVIVRR